MNIALWVVQALLALAFLGSGGMKLTSAMSSLPPLMAPFPELFIRFIGLAEVLGGIGLIVPMLTKIQPRLTPMAALGLLIIMVGAVGTHVLQGDVPGAAPSLVLGALCAFVFNGRRGLMS